MNLWPPRYRDIIFVLLMLTANGEDTNRTCSLGPSIIPLTNWSGTIQSPLTDSGTYFANQKCSWSIKLPEESRIKLDIVQIDLEHNEYTGRYKDECYFDYLEVNTSSTIWRECRKLRSWTSNTNQVTVTFLSDRTTQKTGFLLNYIGICGREFYSFNETVKLKIPRLLDKTRPLHCEWTIDLDGQDVPSFKFLHKLNSDLVNLSSWKLSVDGEDFKLNKENLTTIINVLKNKVNNITIIYDGPPIDTSNELPNTDMITAVEIEPGGICGKNFSSLNDTIQLELPSIDEHLHLHCKWVINLHGQGFPGFTFLKRLNPNILNTASWKLSVDGEDLHLEEGNLTNIQLKEKVETLTITYDGFPVDTNIVEIKNNNNKMVTAVEIFPVGPYCEEDASFTYDKIDIVFPRTLAGSNSSIPCPGEIRGFIIRRCVKINGEIKWLRPDLTNCVNQIIVDIDMKVSQFKKQPITRKDAIVGQMIRLYNATSTVDSLQLYPGDMVLSTKIVQKISHLIPNITHGSGIDDYKHVAQSYADVIGSIINTDKVHIWKNIEFSFVEHNLASILTSVENLSENIAKMKVLHQRRRKSVDKSILDETIRVRSKYVEFSISTVDRTKRTEGINVHMGYNTSYITYSSSVFKIVKDNTKQEKAHLYSGKFETIGNLLINAKKEQLKYTSHNDTDFAVINSDVVSTKFLNIPEEKFNSLEQPVTVIFQLQNSSLNYNLLSKCVFMNMSARSPEYRWSNKGCHLDKKRTNITHTVCTCYHLTNFAVLMDIFEVTDSESVINYRILSYISYIGGGLSIICCLTAIIVYEYFRIKKERVRIHEQLAVSIILVQLIFLVGIDRTENKYVCMSIAIALHYFLMSMFCWMLVEGFHLYVMLVKVFKTRTNLKKYLIIGWGVPLAVVAVSAGVFHDRYGNSKVCWLSHELLLAAFVPAVGFVIFVNTVILLMVLRITTRSLSSSPKYNTEDKSIVKSGLKAAAVLLPLLGLTWTFGFLTINSQGTIVFTYLFTFFNSLQGVFFFAFHCLLSVDVKNAYHRHSYRKSMMSFTYTSTKSGRKSSDWNSYYSNDSKASSRTHMTDVSNADKRMSVLGNADDRIHRNPDMFRDVWLKNDLSNHRNLLRSYSEDIPSWKQNESHMLFRRSLSKIESFSNVDPYEINKSESDMNSSTLPGMRMPRISLSNKTDVQQRDLILDGGQDHYSQSESTLHNYDSGYDIDISKSQPPYQTENDLESSLDNDDVFVSDSREVGSRRGVSRSLSFDNDAHIDRENLMDELKRKTSSIRST